MLCMLSLISDQELEGLDYNRSSREDIRMKLSKVRNTQINSEGGLIITKQEAELQEHKMLLNKALYMVKSFKDMYWA